MRMVALKRCMNGVSDMARHRVGKNDVLIYTVYDKYFTIIRAKEADNEDSN